MVGPTRSRDELISSFAGSLFAAMLGEVVMDAALQAHRDIVRGKAICDVCGTRCGSVHTQGASSNGAGSSAVLAPAPNSPATGGKTVTGISTPTPKDKNDGNIYFECTNCQKKIASNRYAPHLSGCLGIGTGSRRGAARNAAAKNKLGTEPDRSGSPFVGSDYGSPPEATNGKIKGKFKNGKKINGKVAEAMLNGNDKRPMTPDVPLSKKSKKQKTSAASSLASLVPEDGNFSKPYIPTASKRPPKLGTTATSPYALGSPSAASASQYSGHDSPSASGSGSSFNAQSPGARLSGLHKVPTSHGPGSEESRRRSRPFSPEKNQLASTDAASAQRKTDEDADFIDVDGEDRDESSSEST